MKIKYILILVLVFIDPRELFADYKPIFSHFGYPTQTFISPSAGIIPNSQFKTDFSLNTSTILKGSSGILLTADVYNRSFVPEQYKMVGIIPTKVFVEHKLGICFVKKISREEYFYVGPSLRTIDLMTGEYWKPNYEQVLSLSKGYHNVGFILGFNKVIKEKLAIVTSVGMFNSKHVPIMYNIDLNFVPIDNVCISIGSADTDLHYSLSLINGWGRIGYRGNYINNNFYHGIFAGLSLNY